MYVRCFISYRLVVWVSKQVRSSAFIADLISDLDNIVIMSCLLYSADDNPVQWSRRKYTAIRSRTHCRRYVNVTRRIRNNAPKRFEELCWRNEKPKHQTKRPARHLVYSRYRRKFMWFGTEVKLQHILFIPNPLALYSVAWRFYHVIICTDSSLHLYGV